MALEVVSGHETVYLGKLEVGQKLCGFLKGATVEDNKWGNKSFNLIMVRPETGAEFKVLTGGDASYKAKNVAAFLGLFAKDPKRLADETRDGALVGHYIEITRTGQFVNKQGKTVATYQFACDQARTIPTVTIQAPPEAPSAVEGIPF